jgi:peroxiredoxin
MRTKFLAVLIALAVLFSFQTGLTGESGDATTEFSELMSKIGAKVQAGKASEKDLEPELKQLEELIARHKSEKTEAVAQIVFMKSIIYSQLFDNSDKAIEAYKQLKADFPDSSFARDADQRIASIEKQAKLKKGAAFPDFEEKNLADQTVTLAKYRGKVVLIDFWATWCAPCVAELPHVSSTYEKHHAEGFDVLGVSLDEQRSQLESFVQRRKLPWTQICDYKGFTGKLPSQCGVMSIPSTFLLDREGRIIAKNLRGEALEEAVAAALKQK